MRDGRGKKGVGVGLDPGRGGAEMRALEGVALAGAEGATGGGARAGKGAGCYREDLGNGRGGGLGGWGEGLTPCLAAPYERSLDAAVAWTWQEVAKIPPGGFGGPRRLGPQMQRLLAGWGQDWVWVGLAGGCMWGLY